MKSKQLSYIILVILAVVIILSARFFSIMSAEGKNEGNDDICKPTQLNKILDNSMSDSPQLKNMEKKIRNYMDYWHIRGAQIAIVRNDSLLYCKGFGIADSLDSGNPSMEVSNIMRVASVSKLITATAIMKLIEEGKFELNSNIFGENGIIQDSLYTNAIGERISDYQKITIEHLLRHQAGFRRDPVFSANDVRIQMGLNHSPNFEDYSKLVLSRSLKFCPGESQDYSNYGYMLLSKIIEVVSKEDYENYIKESILAPAGCFDMHIANNYYNEKFDNEVRYFMHAGNGRMVNEYNGSGKFVLRCYGGNDVKLLQGAGAWVCSAAELARFVSAINLDDRVKNILSKESIEKMVEYFDENTYSLGWNDTNPDKYWNRTGTLGGTNAVIHCYPDGETWIYLSNTSTWKGPKHARYTGKLFEECRNQYSSLLPKQDLFTRPKVD